MSVSGDIIRDHNGRSLWHGERNRWLDESARNVDNAVRDKKTAFVAIGGGAEVKHNNVFEINFNLTINGSISPEATDALKEIVNEIREISGAPRQTSYKNKGGQPKKGFWRKKRDD